MGSRFTTWLDDCRINWVKLEPSFYLLPCNWYQSMRWTIIKIISSNTRPLQNTMPQKIPFKGRNGQKLCSPMFHCQLYQADSSQLWYQHIFVYKQWRQTGTSVYRCVGDRRQYRGTPRTPKQRGTCAPVGGSRNWCAQRSWQKQRPQLEFDAIVSSELFWRIWGLLGDTFLAFSLAQSPAPLHVFMLSITGPALILCVFSCLLFNIPPPASLSSISLQQITACLQPPGCSPQLFWLRLQIYLYYTMQRGWRFWWSFCVSGECIFHNLTAWAQVLLALIDVRLSLAGPAWGCSIKWSIVKSEQRRGGLSNKFRICGWGKKLQLACWLLPWGWVCWAVLLSDNTWL